MNFSSSESLFEALSKSLDHPSDLPAALSRRRLVQGLVAAPFISGLSGLSACGGKAHEKDADASDPNTGGSDTTPPVSVSLDNQVEDTTLPTVSTLVHPGLLHTQADFVRMREKVAAGASPWIEGWNALLASGYASATATPRPLATVIRGGDGSNFAQMYIDIARTYQLALRWQVTGDTLYADKAVEFLNAWSSTMTALTGNADRFLAAGIYGYEWANAAELMRSYPGWAAADIQSFQNLLSGIFYPLSHDFLINHNGSEITNYWANWDLCAISAIFAIGVFCDKPDYCNEALAYYTGGRGNGSAAHNVYVLHPGHLGQWQESGRDQGHSTLGIALVGALAEMAWNQGIDLYGFRNNRLLAGAEYVAKTNLADAAGNTYVVPYAPYANRQGQTTDISSSGRPFYRPCWESVYNHYTKRKGLAAPWVTAMTLGHQPEGNTAGDQLGFGTLSFSRDAYAEALAPSGLRGCLREGQVLLSWWGCTTATSYKVKRAASASGPFTTIGSVTELLTYPDAVANGTWYYAVSAVTPSGETADSKAIRIVTPVEARVVLPLTGNANDTSGAGSHGTLNGGTAWGAGRGSAQALQLDGTNGYLSLPNGIMAALGDFSISTWVYWNSAVPFTRVFDFGSSDIAYLALIPKDGAGVMRCTLTGTTGWGEQSIVASSALPTGRWVHVAVTLSGTVGKLYLDGAEVGSGSGITFAPFQMGTTVQNWIGRSQYAADPFFNGRLQDFRIHAGALTAADVAAMAAVAAG
ncbi:LamG-like jellyroll fold domain-containing protein [Roseateles sp. YR242]|uniref:LamG-like jellyroll fold domain-containing protein n=1 Tax=Roseateles sp. YR242 TaxID=1855305 RepID=UPI002100FAFF|nr:LamG-like jellyroll fold domain-containing protein [Roseateles sp. YR242]